MAQILLYNKQMPQTSSNVRPDSEDMSPTSVNVRPDSEHVQDIVQREWGCSSMRQTSPNVCGDSENVPISTCITCITC